MARFPFRTMTAALLLLGVGHALGQTTIYVAREIRTLDSRKPVVEAVAVRDGRFLAVGTLADVEAAVGRDATIDRSFADKVAMAGFVEQHVASLLATLPMSSDVVAPGHAANLTILENGIVWATMHDGQIRPVRASPSRAGWNDKARRDAAYARHPASRGRNFEDEPAGRGPLGTNPAACPPGCTCTASRQLGRPTSDATDANTIRPIRRQP